MSIKEIQIIVDSALPSGTVYFVRARKSNETDEEWGRSMAVIYNVGALDETEATRNDD